MWMIQIRTIDQRWQNVCSYGYHWSQEIAQKRFDELRKLGKLRSDRSYRIQNKT